jgi:hypothetical protein
MNSLLEPETSGTTFLSSSSARSAARSRTRRLIDHAEGACGINAGPSRFIGQDPTNYETLVAAKHKRRAGRGYSVANKKRLHPLTALNMLHQENSSRRRDGLHADAQLVDGNEAD